MLDLQNFSKTGDTRCFRAFGAALLDLPKIPVAAPAPGETPSDADAAEGKPGAKHLIYTLGSVGALRPVGRWRAGFGRIIIRGVLQRRRV